MTIREYACRAMQGEQNRACDRSDCIAGFVPLTYAEARMKVPVGEWMAGAWCKTVECPNCKEKQQQEKEDGNSGR